MPSTPLKVAVFISGGGTTLKNLIDKIAQAQLTLDIRLVISSSPTAGGLAHAAAAGIPSLVVTRAACADVEQFSARCFEPCRQAGVELVLMAGYLKHVPIPSDFENRVMNIHPSLIPAFCGQGMYGPKVHQAVLDYGVKVSGCTVHFVDNQFDHGPIILQRVAPVLEGDTPQTLAARVFAAECDAYPEAIRAFAEGRLRIDGRFVAMREQAS